MKKLKQFLFLLIILSCFAIQPDLFAQIGWVQQYSGTTAALYNMSFLNANTGYIIGDSSVIIKTTNSGVNWNRIILPRIVAGSYKSICFPKTDQIGNANINIGYCSLSDTIYKTTNAGQNWFALLGRTYTSCYFTKVYFVNTLLGFATFYEDWSVYRTTNGGMNWTLHNPGGTNNTFYDIEFFNASTGIACGYYYAGPTNNFGTIFQTTNSGINWNYVGGLSTNMYIRGVTVADSVTCFAFSSYRVMRSVNTGTNWSTFGYVFSPAITGMDFVNANKGFLSASNANNGFVYRTTNGGANFYPQTISSPPLNDIYCVNDSTAFVCGNNGAVLKTTNSGGPTGIINQESDKPDYRLAQNYPNPFNQSTIFNLQSSVKGMVTLKVYDISGREVQTLVNEILQPGVYEIRFDGSKLGSGVYFYRMTTYRFSETKRMILLK